jgi:hypothetical protein
MTQTSALATAATRREGLPFGLAARMIMEVGP